MRTLPAVMADLIAEGGPFIGDDGAPHGRVTVEKLWTLSTESGVTTLVPSKLPFRWWQRLDNSQVETEVPNIKSIGIDRTLDADAATCEIVLYNQQMDGNTVAGQTGELGSPGYYTWNYGGRDALARWGQSSSSWNNVLIPNALLRTYQGYGGRDNTITQAVADGNLLLTGVWLIDEVRVGTDATLTLQCRDMAKLLIEQQLFPPLMPQSNWYPLAYQRWKYNTHTNPGVPVYDYTDPVENAPEGWPKYVTDISISADGAGYWLCGTDGGVFSFNVPFFGSRGTELENAKTSSMCADPLGRGYWIFGEDGGVFTFGEVQHYGDPVGSTVSPIIAAAAHPDGRGYWMLDQQGHVYAFGSADHHGGEPVGASTTVDIGATVSGDGYWILDEDGHIYAFGDAVYHGGADGPFLNGRASGLAIHPDGDGYWVVTEAGQRVAIGSAELWEHNGPHWEEDVMPILNDPIFAISATPTGNGYLLVGGDGGVFSFGDAPFWGSLPEPFTYTTKEDGNYTDYVDIIKDLLLWSGWLAYGAGDDSVYGTLETTGAYTDGELPPDLFDKKPVIDALNAIKEIVGYHLWIDEEGAAQFQSPNWPDFHGWGNFLEDGTRVETLPVIDEQFQLTDYTVSYHDTSVRSELIISSKDPTAGFTDTVTTKEKITSDLLRGMVRPAMWVNEYLSRADEQLRMIERLLLHIEFSLRQGTVSCVANPAIQINDQIRIYERQTGETFVHYVRGIRSDMDLDSGTYMTTITTNWLGEDSAE